MSELRTIGDRDQLIADVAAFQGEAWDIALQEPDTDKLKFKDRAPYAKVLTGGGMSIDIGRPSTLRQDSRQAHIKFAAGALLDTGKTFDALVAEGKLVEALAEELKDQLRKQLGGVLELALVVVDNRPCIARTDELSPFALSGHLPELEAAHYEKCEAAVRDLRALGALEDRNNVGFLGLSPKVLNLTTINRGYRIVGRSPNVDPNANILDLPWQGLHDEANAQGAGAIHSMEGERSNVVRAVILESVRRRLQSCLA